MILEPRLRYVFEINAHVYDVVEKSRKNEEIANAQVYSIYFDDKIKIFWIRFSYVYSESDEELTNDNGIFVKIDSKKNEVNELINIFIKSQYFKSIIENVIEEMEEMDEVNVKKIDVVLKEVDIQGTSIFTKDVKKVSIEVLKRCLQV